MWLLLGYPSNILWYPSKYWNYFSKMKLGWFTHSPQSLPVDIFLNIHLTKNIIEHKRCRIWFLDGLYTCLISVFLNDKYTIYKFFIFCFSKLAILAYFDPKLLFFSLELLLKYFYIQNIAEITNWGRLGLKSQKLTFFARQLKIHYIHKHSNICHALNFHCK